MTTAPSLDTFTCPALPERHRRAREVALAHLTPKARWLADGMRMLYTIPAGVEATAEELRFWLIREGLTDPVSSSHWGSFTAAYLGRGVMVSTGRHRAALQVGSRRLNQIYERATDD